VTERSFEKKERPVRGGAVRWTLVWAVFAVTLLAAMGGGAYVYFVLLRYERVVAHHVPPMAVGAARLDVEQAIVYEPVRRHLLPVIDEGLASSPEHADGLERLQAATRINLGRDLREVLFASGPEGDDWVVVFGGMFPRDGVISGLAELLRKRGGGWDVHPDRAIGPGGIGIGQATDGSIALASSVVWLEAALPSRDPHVELGLPREGPGAAALDLDRMLPGAGMRRATAELELGSPMSIDLRVEVVPGAGAAPRERVIELLSSESPSGNPVLDEIELRQALTNAGPDRLEATIAWERTEMDRIAALVADELRGAWLGPSGAGGTD
jgi:hypothetical protein